MDQLVSVIIPTYKRYGETLEDAIKSVLEQSYKKIEIIVVDDNDNDVFTKSIIKLLDKYRMVKYVSYEGNKGACFARNEGIHNSDGELCAFLDDDDEWYSEKIEKQVEKFRNDSVALVYCGIHYYYEKQDKYRKAYGVIKSNPVKELLYENYIGSTSCGMVRKSSAIAVGLFDTNLKSGQDLDFWIRLAQNYEIDCVTECLIKYTLYENDSITSNVKNRLISNLYLFSKYKEIIKKDEMLSTTYVLKIFKSYLINKKIFIGASFGVKSFIKREISINGIIKVYNRIELKKGAK